MPSWAPSRICANSQTTVPSPSSAVGSTWAVGLTVTPIPGELPSSPRRSPYRVSACDHARLSSSILVAVDCLPGDRAFVLEATVVLQVRHLDSAREGIASLLAQTMSADKMELIIIDAGLDDNDAEMLRTMAAEEPKLRLVSAPIDEGSTRPPTGLRENGGFRFANVGVDHARGKYIMFSSTNRIFVPNTLERLYALGSANSADVVFSRTGSPEAYLPSELLARRPQTIVSYCGDPARRRGFGQIAPH